MQRMLRVVVGVSLVAGLVLAPVTALAGGEPEPDGRAHPSFVEGILDENGRLWFKVGFYMPWGEEPPRDIFSLYWAMDVITDDAAARVAWDTHDRVETYRGDPGTEAYILDNGCVLIGTGLMPTGDFHVSIVAEFRSWLTESDPVLDGFTSMGTSAEFIDSGDPFKAFGGDPVWNLTTGQPFSSEPATATTSSSSSTSSTTTTLGSSTEDTTGGTNDDLVVGGSEDLTSGGGVPFVLVLLALMLLGAGYYFSVYFGWWTSPLPWPQARYAYRVGGAHDLVIDEKTEDGAATDDIDTTSTTGDSVIDDSTVPVPADTTAESDDGRIWDDDSLLRFFNAEDAKWELGKADYERWKALTAIEATNLWESTRLAEEQVQDAIELAVARIVEPMASGIKDFTSATSGYADAMGTIIEASDELVALKHDWEKEGGTRDIMWWVDLADAIIGVAELAANIGIGASKLVVGALSASDEAADAGQAAAKVADEALDAASSPPPNRMVHEIYPDSNHDEMHDFIQGVVGEEFHFQDISKHLPEAAHRLGFYVGFSDADREIIQRLIAKARLASKGNPVEFGADDLAWLHRMAQDPQFWDNLQRGAALDLDWRMYRIVDETDLGFLRQLADAPETARAADNVPTVILSPPTQGDTLAPPGVMLAGETAAPPGGIVVPGLSADELESTVILPTIAEAAADPVTVPSLPGIPAYTDPAPSPIVDVLTSSSVPAAVTGIGMDLGLIEGP